VFHRPTVQGRLPGSAIKTTIPHVLSSSSSSSSSDGGSSSSSSNSTEALRGSLEQPCVLLAVPQLACVCKSFAGAAETAQQGLIREQLERWAAVDAAREQQEHARQAVCRTATEYQDWCIWERRWRRQCKEVAVAEAKTVAADEWALLTSQCEPTRKVGTLTHNTGDGADCAR